MPEGQQADIAAALREIGLFSEVEDKDLRLIAPAFRRVTFPGGTTILREGEPGDDFFVLLGGTAQVLRGGKTLSTLAPGQFFGELGSMGLHAARTASVFASEPCTCLVSRGSDLEMVLSANPSVAKRIMAEIHDRYSDEVHHARADW